MRAVLLAFDLICTFLVQDLGNRRFTRRENAYDQLQRLGSAAWPYLSRGCEDDDPEVSARCRRLLRGMDDEYTWELAGMILPPGCRHHPWLYFEEDAFQDGWNGPTTLRWVEEAGRKSNSPVQNYRHYRLATRLWVQSQLRLFRSPIEIRFDLAVMANAEANYWMQHYRFWKVLPRRIVNP